MYAAILVQCALAALTTPGEEYAGTRSLGMAHATRGLASSNEAIFVNAAGMAMTQRYAIELNYLYGFELDQAFPALSVVDSRTSSLAAGLAYTYERAPGGKLANHRVYLAFAYPLGDLAAIGLTTKYVKVGDKLLDLDFHAFTGDLSFMLRPIPGLMLGIIGYNLIDNGHDEYLPIMLGGGISFALETFAVDFDFVTNMAKTEDPQYRYLVGGEYLIAGQMPIRAGFQHDDDTGRNHWSLGTGWLTPTGAIELSYRQDARHPPNRDLSLSLRLFL